MERDRHTVFNVVVTRFLDRGRGAFAPASPNALDEVCVVVAQLLPLPTCSSGRWPTSRISLEPVATINTLRSIVCAQSAGAQDQLRNIADVEVLFLQKFL